MLKILYASCLGLSQTIAAQFTLEMCVADQNRKKSVKKLIMRVQGHSRSLILMSIERAYETSY